MPRPTHERRAHLVTRHGLGVRHERQARFTAERFVDRALASRASRLPRPARRAQRIQALGIRGHDARAERRAHAGRHHVHAGANRRRPGVGPTGKRRARSRMSISSWSWAESPRATPGGARLTGSGAQLEYQRACGTFGHSARGRSRIVVSVIENGAGSVAVSARPILPKRERHLRDVRRFAGPVVSARPRHRRQSRRGGPSA